MDERQDRHRKEETANQPDVREIISYGDVNDRDRGDDAERCGDDHDPEEHDRLGPHD